MVEKISVQIALEGGADVEKQLADIGKTGNEAFAGLNEAGTTAAEGIAAAGEASATTGEQLDKVQSSADKTGEALRGITLESVKTSAEIAKVGLEIAKLSVEIGLAVTRHKTLAQSLLSLASGANTAVKALGLLAPELTAAGAALVPVVAAVAGAVIAFEAIEKTATAAASGYEKLNHSLQMLATTSGQSFDSLQRGQAAFGQLGISAEGFDGIMRKVAETLGGLDIGGELKKSADEAADALLKVRQAEDALFKSGTSADELIPAQKRLADAYAKTGEVAANSIGKILEQVKAIEAGQKGLTFDPLVKSETIIKAVALSMKEVADQGEIAGQVLVNFIAQADKLTAIKVGAAFGITAEDVDRIKNLGGQLGVVDQIWKRIQGAGVLIPPESAAAFERMRVSIQGVDSAWVRLQQALQSSVIATVAADFSNSLNSMKMAVINFAAAAVEQFNRAASAMSAFANTQRELETVGAVLTALSKGDFSGAFKALIGDSQQATQAVQGTNQALQQTAQAAQQTAQAFQIVPNPFTGMPEAIRTTNTALQQTGQAGAQAGQQVAQGFTSANAVLARIQANAGQTGQALAQTGQAAAQAGQQIVQAGQEGTSAWQMLPAAVDQATAQVNSFASAVASITWDAISSVGVAAWDAITGAIQSAIDALLKFIGLKPSAPATGGGAPGKARGGLLGGRGTGTSDSNLAWLSRGEYIMPARAVRQPRVLSFLESLRRGGGIPGYAQGGLIGGTDALASTISGWVGSITAANNAAVHAIQATQIELARVIESLEAIWQALSDKLFTTVKAMTNVVNNLRGVRGAARGGLLNGRGTGTSDSNLAWVSRGEHIMPARAVRQPGVLEFLELLRRSGGNLRAVLDSMGRFALGGMVPRAMPAFAAGGLNGGMSNVTIQFPGLPAIGGLRASSDVVDQLHKAAALAQVRSGGRKPSRYS